MSGMLDANGNLIRVRLIAPREEPVIAETPPFAPESEDEIRVRLKTVGGSNATPCGPGEYVRIGPGGSVICSPIVACPPGEIGFKDHDGVRFCAPPCANDGQTRLGPGLPCVSKGGGEIIIERGPPPQLDQEEIAPVREPAAGGSGLGVALAGAGAGFAVGGPVGALAGGVVGWWLGRE